MIFELLPIGKKNAISTVQLCTITGLNVRELRKTVAHEREAGKIILSCNDGYFLPADRTEVQEFVKVLEAKGKSILYVLKSSRKYLRETAPEAAGQIRM